MHAGIERFRPRDALGVPASPAFFFFFGFHLCASRGTEPHVALRSMYSIYGINMWYSEFSSVLFPP